MENIKLLKKIEFLNGLSTMELTKISRICKESVYEMGDEIVSEGDECNSFFIIKEGTVNVIKGDKTVSMLSDGSPIGEVSFIDRGPRSATVKAAKRTVLIEIPTREFDKALKEDKDMASIVYRSIAVTLCKRLRFTNDMLLILSD
ncbi:MAG: cyclic nucleotide-binding domain-containing protein [Nitrospirota bacterium]|nr:MAG: cyclic nucleotide-binding domain-containing protein [Nitrospirota bacterium]